MTTSLPFPVSPLGKAGAGGFPPRSKPRCSPHKEGCALVYPPSAPGNLGHRKFPPGRHAVLRIQAHFGPFARRTRGWKPKKRAEKPLPPGWSHPPKKVSRTGPKNVTSSKIV